MNDIGLLAYLGVLIFLPPLFSVEFWPMKHENDTLLANWCHAKFADIHNYSKICLINERNTLLKISAIQYMSAIDLADCITCKSNRIYLELQPHVNIWQWQTNRAMDKLCTWWAFLGFQLHKAFTMHKFLMFLAIPLWGRRLHAYESLTSSVFRLLGHTVILACKCPAAMSICLVKASTFDHNFISYM